MSIFNRRACELYKQHGYLRPTISSRLLKFDLWTSLAVKTRETTMGWVDKTITVSTCHRDKLKLWLYCRNCGLWLAGNVNVVHLYSYENHLHQLPVYLLNSPLVLILYTLFQKIWKKCSKYSLVLPPSFPISLDTVSFLAFPLEFFSCFLTTGPFSTYKKKEKQQLLFHIISSLQKTIHHKFWSQRFQTNSLVMCKL